jgi:phosphoglycolate phosphatase-like HAD superfamily hydrolase
MLSGGRIAVVSDFQYWGRNSQSLVATGATLASTHHKLADKLKTSEVVLKKLKIEGTDAVAIGDSPYDAEAAGKADVRTIGVLCGGFTETELRKAGSRLAALGRDRDFRSRHP